MPEPRTDYDTSTDALLVRTGSRRWDYGAVATIRTLGRLGIAVHAFADDDEPEVTRSAFLESVVGPTLDPEQPAAAQIAALNRFVEGSGRPTVLIAGDDESAVLIAEGRPRLDPRLLSFPVDGPLPRRLADKVSLHDICVDAGVPTPAMRSSGDPEVLRGFARDRGFPLVAKNPEPYERLDSPGVARTTVLSDIGELEEVLAAWDGRSEILLQEYLPPADRQEWYVEGLRGPGGEWLAMTGRKVAAHPVGTGVGWFSTTAPNPALAEQAKRFCALVGYVGVFDSDWLVDADGVGRLIDFNPRRGAQFRLFVTSAGVDVVRAAHLLLSGRAIPAGEQVFDRALSIGHLAVQHPSVLAHARRRADADRVERAWWTADDPVPGLVMAGSVAAGATRKVGRAVAGRVRATAPRGG